MNGFTVVLPVKPWGLAKSRLEIDHRTRAALARAFSLDVLDVVCASSLVDRIVVVTTETELAGLARRRGAAVAADRPVLSAGQLNAAVGLGRAWAMSHAAARPVVVVPADLPAMTVEVFDVALTGLARHDRAFVPDTPGEGTTLLSASRPVDLRALYGRGSARCHLADGVHALVDVDDRVRRDVDIATDLRDARRLGLAPESARVVEEFLSADASMTRGRRRAANGVTGPVSKPTPGSAVHAIKI